MSDPRRLAALALAEEIQARQKLVEIGTSVELQLRDDEWNVVHAMLSRAQDEAATALEQLTVAPPDRPDVIRELQNKMWRYESLVRWLRDMVEEGGVAAAKNDAERMEFYRELILHLDDETRAAIGLAEPQAGTE